MVNSKAVITLLNKTSFFDNCENILEPCAYNRSVVKIINEFYSGSKNITEIDIVNNKSSNVTIVDFLSWQTNEKYDGVITSPPYNLTEKYVEKCFSVLKNNGVIAMFIKMQFLEGNEREMFFKNYPPKYIYIFGDKVDNSCCA